MTRTTTTILLLTTLALATPSAEASWLWKSEIDIPVLHVGDRFSYSVEEPAVAFVDDDARHYQAFRTLVMHVEGPSVATDRFGIERETVAVRSDVLEDGELVSAEVCHQLAGGREAVRTDVLAGQGGSGFAWSTEFDAGPLAVGESATGTSHILARFNVESCVGPAHLQGATLREGARIPFAALGLEDSDDVSGLDSQPAVATTFAGRDALRYSFDVKDLLRAVYGERITDEQLDTFEGGVDVTLADGIPVAAAMDVDIRELGEDEAIVLHLALTGIEAGEGPALSLGEATLPEENPSASFIAPDPLRFDDSALALPLRYDAAYEALLVDPRAGFGGWLEDHPDARLAMAAFFVGSSPTSVVAPPNDNGGWFLQFAEGREGFMGYVVAPTSVRTPLGAIAAPASIPILANWNDDAWEGEVAIPARQIDGASLGELAAASGISPGTIRGLVSFGASLGGEPWAAVILSQANAFSGDVEGYGVLIDATEGAMLAVTAEAVDRESAIPALEPATGSVERGSTGVAALRAPSLLDGATVAAGVGLLALLLKFVLLPLFTRLRRDRLLDNPVRARMYERVRAEPGIHLAELEEFLGIGKGATRHHVDQLVSHKLVFVLDEDGFSRCYAAGHVPLDVARRTAALRAGSNARVYELYAARPSLTLREAARELGMSAPSVHRAKKRLEKEGLLPAAMSVQLRT